MLRHIRNICTKSLVALTVSIAAVACSDDDTFTTSSSAALSFGTDTIRFDTIFSNIPSSYRMFWVRNNNAEGLRIANVRLLSGNQTGFRVNVNGSALSQQQGYQTNDIELRSGDSLRVFVEITSPFNNAADGKPQQVADDLVFTLESGRQQKVNLNAYSWDATLLRHYTISKDTTLSAENGRPIVVYDTLRVVPNVTLEIAPSTVLYMHDGAVINVSGSLKSLGAKDAEVIIRSDRLDNLFTYLPYDNTPGRWKGIVLDSLSKDNLIQYTDIHSAVNAVTLKNSQLTLTHSTIHNNLGYGVSSSSSQIFIKNSQISNCLGHCVNLCGDSAIINQSTIAQYYPFSAMRGNALNVKMDSTKYNKYGSLKLLNTIVTGYSDDELSMQVPNGVPPTQLDVNIHHSLLRTPAPADTSQYSRFCGEGNIYEDAGDTLTLPKNRFKVFDTQNFIYDFTPLAKSPVISAADPVTSTDADDRRGITRKQVPDIGCYENREE